MSTLWACDRCSEFFSSRTKGFAVLLSGMDYNEETQKYELCGKCYLAVRETLSTFENKANAAIESRDADAPSEEFMEGVRYALANPTIGENLESKNDSST